MADMNVNLLCTYLHSGYFNLNTTIIDFYNDFLSAFVESEIIFCCINNIAQYIIIWFIYI